MPRKRITNKHLPERIYHKGQSYYFVNRENKWLNLGSILPQAILKWSLINERSVAFTKMSVVIDRYLLDVSPTKSKSSYRNDITCSKPLKVAFGDMCPDDITPVDIYKYLDIRAQTAPVSANRETSLLSHVYTMAIRWGITKDNPCKHVKKLKEAKRDRYISDEEYNAVYNIATGSVKCAMQLAYITSLRQSDILNLSYANLGHKGIEVEISKTGQKVLIEWTPALSDAVEQCRKTSTYKSEYLVCTERGQQYTTDGFRSNWQRLIKTALDKGIIKESFRFHDLRRKSLTDAERSHGREFARQLADHTDQKTTDIYISGRKTIRPLK
jgi:integrase